MLRKLWLILQLELELLANIVTQPADVACLKVTLYSYFRKLNRESTNPLQQLNKYDSLCVIDNYSFFFSFLTT